jgi:hypothetical protein
MNSRIPCCVPFCKRTAPRSRFPDAGEIICGKHWRLIDKRVRALHRAYLRRERAGKPFNFAASFWNWQRCKRQAIEAAMGVR